jgi:GntR family transcriptional repressor for pyruvate dehydrogenase complex
MVLPNQKQNGSEETGMTMYTKIETERIPERVMRQIKNSILKKEIQKGDQLPPERDMADQMGVSRSAVREALSYLSAIGIIEKKGDGNCVASNLENVFKEPFSLVLQLEDVPFEEITDLRRLLEDQRASLAMENMSEADFQHLDDLCEPFLEAPNGEGLRKADKDYHSFLAEKANSKLITILLNSIYDSAMKGGRSWQAISRNPDKRRELYQAHKRLSAALRAKDVPFIKEAMEKHFDFVNKNFGLDDD